MRLTELVFVGTLSLAITVNNAVAADARCADKTYRDAHTELCGQTASDGHTLAIFGTAAALMGGALAATGLALNGGGGSHTAEVTIAPRIPTYPTPQLGGNKSDTLHNVDDDILNQILGDNNYIQNAHAYDDIGVVWSRGRGYTGRGTTIAVLDTGNRYWHGRIVMDVIGAVIAPDANVEMHRVATNATTFYTWSEIGEIVANAATNADVINNSWNISLAADAVTSREHIAAITDAGFIDAVANAARDGTIFVWAAGNDGGQQSGALSVLPKYIPELKGLFINVVAWDSELGRLADFSNACGVTKDWCITAPGTDIDSLGYNVDGTSFAAPMVSGAIAVLKQAFPYLTPEQITALIFMTATDLGAPGVDEIYGHGMLDLENATRPVGDATIAGANGTIQPLRAAHIPGAIAHNMHGTDLKFAYFDAFGRPYQANLADNIRVRNRGFGIDRLRGDRRTAAKIGNFEFGFSTSEFVAGDGFMKTDGDTNTHFVATTWERKVGGFTLFNRAQIGTSHPRPAPESIIAEFSSVTSASLTFGARYGNWTFSIGAPDTIINGKMTLRIPTGRADSGAILYRDERISIASAPSLEYSASYGPITLGFVDNPYGTDEVYVIGKSKLRF